MSAPDHEHVPPPATTGALEEQQHSLRPRAGVLVLGVGVWLTIARGLVDYPLSAAGRHASLRDDGFAVGLLLAGLVLTFFRPRLLAAVLAVLIALGMIVCAALIDYPTTLRLLDAGLGLVVLVGAGLGVRERRPA